MTDDIAKIARGLTKGQLAAVLSLSPEEMRPFRELHGIIRLALFRKGILTNCWPGNVLSHYLTPLGLAVRAHLMENPHA